MIKLLSLSLLSATLTLSALAYDADKAMQNENSTLVSHKKHVQIQHFS